MPLNAQPTSVLSMETSCPRATICLRVNGKTLFSSEWHAERSHNSRVFDILKDAKPYLDENPPSLILVGAGPGSYSGVRVALAAADGLSLVYGARVVSLPSWEALPHDGGHALVLSDARRGGWAVGVLNEGRLDLPLKILNKAEMDELLSAPENKDSLLLSTELAEKLEANGWTAVRTGLVPDAAALLDAWERRTDEEREILGKIPPSPIYVREPHITQAKRSAWEKGRDGAKIKD